MKKRIAGILMTMLIVFSFGVFAVGSGSKDSSNGSDNNAIGSYDNPLTVGNTMESNGLKITLNSSDLNYTGYDNRYGIHTPKDGMKYVAASFTYQNDGDRDAYVSIYDFKCYADGTACQQEYGLDPEGAQTVELEYDANIWSNKKAYIRL